MFLRNVGKLLDQRCYSPWTFLMHVLWDILWDPLFFRERAVPADNKVKHIKKLFCPK
jgi:hypothetical protein